MPKFLPITQKSQVTASGFYGIIAPVKLADFENP